MANAPEIKSDFEVLDTILRMNQSEIDRVEQVIQQLRRERLELEPEFQGEAADRFFLEFDDRLMPRLKRLFDALGECHEVVQRIVQTVEEAEENAARLFDTPFWS